MDKEKELDILPVESYDEVMTEAAHDLDMLIPPAPIEEYATIALCNRCNCEQTAKTGNAGIVAAMILRKVNRCR